MHFHFRIKSKVFRQNPKNISQNFSKKSSLSSNLLWSHWVWIVLPTVDLSTAILPTAFLPTAFFDRQKLR
jgi:hypothetical protein